MFIARESAIERIKRTDTTMIAICRFRWERVNCGFLEDFLLFAILKTNLSYIFEGPC